MTFDDALLIAERCFGGLGLKTVYLWRQYNDDYFGGALAVTPILYVPTSPYGRWVGCFRHDRNIYLMYPGNGRSWGFVRGVLLHEMVHQHLAQTGQDPHHDQTPWCSEIMRLSLYFRRNIWAGKYTVKKIAGKSVRANKDRPASKTGESLNQDQISKWPDSIGIEPPDYLQLKVEDSQDRKVKNFG